MFTYNLEYRENILFIRLIGKLNNKTIKVLNGELENIINNLGIYNIVFNLSELVSINTQSVDCLVYWYEQLKNKKG